jgi:hypothetical protein
MPKNTIVGKSTAKGTTKATGRKYKKANEVGKKHQDRRVELNRIARQKGIYGKRHAMGKDLSHKKDGTVVLEKSSVNRSRNGKKKGTSSLKP